MPLIAPSLLSANFLQLAETCEMLNQSKADWYHLDIMDGCFVPNISFGPLVVKFITQATTKFCDVHLMIQNPGNFAEAFKNAGANQLTIHYEACCHLHKNIEQIKTLGMQVGVAINPHTPVNFLADIIADIDTVLIMSVNPGFGGQQFIAHTIQKIKEAKKLIYSLGLETKIEVDGGVTLENAAEIIHAGANVLVAGSSVFNSSNPIEIISKLKEIQ